MFGTELHLITFLYLALEMVILIVQISVCLSRPKETRRIRFFLLIMLFIFFNLCNGLFPNSTYNIPLLSQVIIAYTSGITLATYYFYFLTKEFNIKTVKYYNPKFLLSSLVVTFIFGFITTYIITGNITLSEEVFIIPPILIGLYFSIRTLLFIYKKQEKPSAHYKTVTLAGYIGVIFMASMPITVFLGDNQSFKVGLVNISFLLSAFAYYKSQLHQTNMEYKVLFDVGYFDTVKNVKERINMVDPFLEYDLTTRENELAELILNNMSYRAIGETSSIEESTVSKHASNIFKKTNCGCKKEFIDKFSEKQNSKSENCL